MTTTQTIILGDCVQELLKLPDECIDICITSPPYNLKIRYGSYKDNKCRDDYLKWLYVVFEQVCRCLKPNGSFFLNVGGSNLDPWITYDVANEARKLFILQNNIIWVKSVAINDITYGHFKPINSKRFLNHAHENIFHFTKTGGVPVDRLSIGVPYTDKSNIKRWGTKADKHCKGNVWYIPYKTVVSKHNKGNHPAIFPELLVENCIKLHGYDASTVVCDPFCGSGTTVAVCKQLNINGITMDIDKNYIDYAKQRVV